MTCLWACAPEHKVDDISAVDDDGLIYADGGGNKDYSHYQDFNPSEYVLHALVDAESTVVGMQVEEAGLRGVGFFLIAVHRGNTVFSAIGPQFVLQAGDVLSFTGGEPKEFVSFARSRRLSPVSVAGDYTNLNSDTPSIASDVVTTSLNANFETIQVIITADSELVGKRVKESDFRGKYNASIIAISRAGERLENSRLGKVVLKIGDRLVLVTNEKFSWADPVTAKDLKPRPEHDDPLKPIEDLRVQREFVIPMVVSRRSQLAIIPSLSRRTIKNTGILDVPGVALISIHRGSSKFDVIDPSFILEEGDVLWFVGDRDSVTGIRRVPGLADAAKKHLDRVAIPTHYRRLIEVVISPRADFVGQTVRESRFRTRYSAAVVSVLRMDFRNLEKIGDYVIKGGDTLIIDAGSDFVKFFRDDQNFSLVSEIPNSTPPRWDKFYIALIASVAMITLEVIFSVNMAVLGVFASAIMLFFGVINGDRAHAAIDWPVIVTVASAFGMSTALENTFVAGIVGNAFVQLAVITGTGVPGLVFTILLATMMFSSLIANNAAALLMFPIAAQAAATMNINPTPILYALMLGASDYATPFGYQTNQMVQKPGLYVPVDYLKFGLPLMIILLITETLFLSVLDYWYISWIVTALIYVLAIVFDVVVRNKTKLKDVIPLPTIEDVRNWNPKATFEKLTSSKLNRDFSVNTFNSSFNRRNNNKAATADAGVVDEENPVYQQVCI